MIDILKRFFGKERPDEGENDSQTGHDLRVAACALFVEMASIDERFTDTEMQAILSILKDKYGLSTELAEALISEAEKELAESVDLWQFARLINENYSNPEKIEIVETLWEIIYTDSKMDAYEHYLMNKLQQLLRLSHDQIIDAKIKVKSAAGF
ncbi:MAG: TerB family tellurite resistance protein [Deltaproteobacteria bacterium]|nr:TerB family tellurite resistance protein [Deltaproteobacteria bacterium]